VGRPRKRSWKQNQKIETKLRVRLNQALNGGGKIGSAVRSLGCSIEELKTHLASLFTLGMTHENRGRGDGKWCIDHIIPLDAFDLQDLEQFRIANHFTNLQPLWWRQNIVKGAKIPLPGP